MQTFFGPEKACLNELIRGIIGSNCLIIHVKWPISGQQNASSRRHRLDGLSKPSAKVPNFGGEKDLERKSKNEIGLSPGLVLNVLNRKLSAAI
jgi:hypothetical protein